MADNFDKPDNDSIVEEISISLNQCDALLIMLEDFKRMVGGNLKNFNLAAIQKYFQQQGYTIEQSIKMANEHVALTQSVFDEIAGINELLIEVRPILEDRNKPKIIPGVPWKKP